MNISKYFVALAIVAGMAAGFAQTGQRNREAIGGGEPRIEVSEVPPSDCGGTDRFEPIAGKAYGVSPSQYRVAIYALACNGVLYVQPAIDSPLTTLGQDGSFEVNIHLGQTYYLLLVPPGYKPQAETRSVPQKGGDIVSVTRVRGRSTREEREKK